MRPYRWEAPSNFHVAEERIDAARGDRGKLDEVFELLTKYQPLINYRFGRGSMYWRGRKAPTEQGFANASQVGPPPPSVTPAGRLNEPKAPVLYAATRMQTVFNELDVVAADYVHLIGIRIKPKAAFHIAMIGELFHVFKTGRSRIMDNVGATLSQWLNGLPNDLGMRVVYVDALLDFHLADPEADKEGYSVTRAIARAVFKKLEHIEAFFYPSVVEDAGANLAMKPQTYESSTHIVISQLVKILRHHQLGLFDYEVCRHATAIEEDGTFEWSNEADDLASKMILFGMTDEEKKFAESHDNRLYGDDYLDLIGLARDN